MGQIEYYTIINRRRWTIDSASTRDEDMRENKACYAYVTINYKYVGQGISISEDNEVRRNLKKSIIRRGANIH